MIDSSVADSRGRSAELLEIMRENDAERLFAFISNGGSPDAVIDKQVTGTPTELLFNPPIISVAVYFSAYECYRCLLEEGASLYACDKNGKKIAYFAVIGGDVRILQDLVEHGADFRGTLVKSAMLGNMGTFLWVFSNANHDIEERNDEGISVFEAASRSGNKQILALIKEEGPRTLSTAEVLASMRNLSTVY